MRLIDVSLDRGGRRVLDRVGLQVPRGRAVALCGPNGAGKSTALAVLAGTLRPDSGRVTLDDQPLPRPTALARRRAVLPQRAVLGFPLAARDVVALGRLPWGAHPNDDARAEAALERVGATHLGDRPWTELSGGERQRVRMARVLCQLDGPAATHLLLDEPTAALDPAVAAVVLREARAEAEAGRGVLAVLHDLSLAASWADRLVLMQDGRVVADGPPAEVLTADRLAAVYGVRARILPHPDTGRPMVAPVPFTTEVRWSPRS